MDQHTDQAAGAVDARAAAVACRGGVRCWRWWPHPDDESFGLGALLAAFADAGAQVSVLCFTDGGASTLRDAPGTAHDRARPGEAAVCAGGDALVGQVQRRVQPHGSTEPLDGQRVRGAGEVFQPVRCGRGDQRGELGQAAARCGQCPVEDRKSVV